MDWLHILQALLSLLFVIGLLLLTLWAVKYCEVKGLKCRFMKQLKADQRLDVIEMRRIDAKNTLVLCKCGQQEFLVLLGSNSNLLLPLNSNSQGTANS